MSLNVARWRPAPLAPRSTGMGLWIAILVVTLIGAMASIVALAGVRTGATWRAQWGDSITVAALGHGLETSDAAAARIEDLLGRQAGVASVKVQDATPNDALIGGLMGATGTPMIEGPRFVIIRLAPGARVAQADLAAPIAAHGIAARYDDHRTLNAPVERAAVIAAGVLAAVLLVVLILIAALATHAARLGVRRVRGRMSLLRSLGATQRFMAAQFPEPVGLSAAIGGLIGAVLAVGLTFGGVDRFAPSWSAALALDGWDLLAAAPWPLIAGLIAWVFARLGAGGALRRLP